jgi:xylose isomerase
MASSTFVFPTPLFPTMQLMAGSKSKDRSEKFLKLISDILSKYIPYSFTGTIRGSPVAQEPSKQQYDKAIKYCFSIT